MTCSTILSESNEEFEEKWAASSPEEKIKLGREFIRELQRLIDNGADIDPQIIDGVEKVIENYRHSKIEEMVAVQNLRITRDEARTARGAYFDSLNDDDLPQV